MMKISKNSLFHRLLLSFFVIIVLFSTFYFVAFYFYQHNMREEIIEYNKTNMEHTQENFDSFFNDLKKGIYGLYFESNILGFNHKLYSQNLKDLILANEINAVLIKEKMNNTHLFIDNILAYYKEESFVIDVQGTYSVTDFAQNYESSLYNEDFWESDIKRKTENYSIYPVDSFYDYDSNQSIQNMLMPVKIEHDFSNNLIFIIFIDAQKLFSNKHFSINDQLIVLNQNDDVIYSTSNIDPSSLPGPDEEKGYVKYDGDYYFYKDGEQGNLTYINIIPSERISAQLFNWNMIFIMILILSIVISILTAIYLSRRINNPMKRIIESIKDLNMNPDQVTNIKEFDIINSNMSEMIQSQKDMTLDLSKKERILRNLAFMNKVKKIKHGINNEINFENESFLMVLFEVEFKDFEKDENVTLERTTHFIREYVHFAIRSDYEQSITFQIENNQILSMIFLSDDEEKIFNVLESMKDMFNIDRSYYLVTIAVSQIHQSSSTMTKAYEEVLDLLTQRRLRDESQLLLEHSPELTPVIMTSQEEQKFYAHVLSGNALGMMNYVNRVLGSLKKQDAFAIQYLQFATNLIARVKFNLLAMNINVNELESLQTLVYECYTHDQYEALFERYFENIQNIIKENKSDKDQITSYVMDYIEENYAKDVSLEVVSDHLKISSGYLSAYFKEKTGINFSDYLNELRVNKAKDLLENTNLKIKEVSNRVGYYNVNSFIRMFKQCMGVTPGEFRKSNIT